MKVFLSWSGPQSKKMAESLKVWLKFIIQSAEPFVSSLDIAKGERGLPVIASELEESSFGIVCITRENSTAPWINFEAGALSRAVGDARVIPCLLDMPVADLTGPLTQFQVVSTANKEDVYAMVQALRDQANLKHLDDNQLRATFEAFWPGLERDLEVARSQDGEATTVRSVRDPGEILEEVLLLARRQESVLRTIVERVDSSVPMLEIRRPGNPDEKPEGLRSIVDELINDLHVLGDNALSYRIISDRIPEEVQVQYDSKAICPENVEEVVSLVGGFVARKGLQVTVFSRDGYRLIAGPGKGTVVLTPTEPEEHPSTEDEETLSS